MGLKEQFRAGDSWAEINSGNLKIGLHAAHGVSGSEAFGYGISINFEVADIHAAVKELKARGVAFTGGVSEDGAVLLAHFDDPSGNPLSLYQERPRQ